MVSPHYAGQKLTWRRGNDARSTSDGGNDVRRWGLALIALVLLVGLDQATKAWVRHAVPFHSVTVLIPGAIDLTYVENPGVSFSFLGSVAAEVRVPVLIGITLLAVALLGSYWVRRRAGMDRWMDDGMVLILAGAMGNLIDRFLRGTVTDFLHFHIGAYSLFVNNAADIFISLGVLAYVLAAYRPGHGPP
jgi:signal peptidase II